MPQQGGVFPSQWIREAVERGIVTSGAEIAPGQIQPNSLDLRLAGSGYRVQCSFLPGEEGMQEKLARFAWYAFSVPEEGMVLERNQNYLFPLCESLNLPAGVHGRGNPKSTTGRLDVFTRIVTEYGTSFDDVPEGYTGKLYLEVVPRSFAVRVRAGDALAQIRFQVGDARLSREETIALIDNENVIFGPDLHILRSRDLNVASGLVLSINLPRKDDRTVGYQARKNTPPIDLRAIGQARVRHHWDRIYGETRAIILEPDEFYIFASRELVRLPPEYCAEMVPFDAGSGELRSHYAGFFDSGFGYHPNAAAERTAAAVVLEVRSRDVPFLIEDNQPIFRFHLMRCTEIPDVLYGQDLRSNYQSQRLRLSKQFNAVPEDEAEATQARLDFTA